MNPYLRKKRKHLSKDEIDEIVILSPTVAPSHLARKYDVDRKTIWNIQKEYGVVRNPITERTLLYTVESQGKGITKADMVEKIYDDSLQNEEDRRKRYLQQCIGNHKNLSNSIDAALTALPGLIIIFRCQVCKTCLGSERGANRIYEV